MNWRSRPGYRVRERGVKRRFSRVRLARVWADRGEVGMISVDMCSYWCLGAPFSYWRSCPFGLLDGEKIAKSSKRVEMEFVGRTSRARSLDDGRY